MSDDAVTGGQATRARVMRAEKRVTALEAQMAELVALVNLLGLNQSQLIGQFNELTGLTRTMAERVYHP